MEKLSSSINILFNQTKKIVTLKYKIIIIIIIIIILIIKKTQR